MTRRLQYIMKRALIAARATNPRWHMQPLTVVYGESGPPVWMQRITKVWHSLWINCASWHALLTVSNSACDLCTAASTIQLEQGHKFYSEAGWVCALSSALSALIVPYEDDVNMTTHSRCLLISRAHSITQAVRLYKPFTRASRYGCMRCWLWTKVRQELERRQSLIVIRDGRICIW